MPPKHPRPPQRPSPWLPSLCLAILAASVNSQGQSPNAPPGIAWAVKGQWRDAASGASLATGSLVHPGALLKPRNPDAPNSITVLLPDGQRILNECFTPIDCNRGFRVPALIDRPSAFQIQLLARIGAVLAQPDQFQRESPATAANSAPPRLDEAVAKLIPQTASPGSRSTFRIAVAGAAAQLPEGNYSYDLRRLGDPSATALHLPWNKNASSALFAVPSPGIYEIAIRDARGIPRIDLTVAAIAPTQPDPSPDLLRAKATLQSWEERNYGWPIHPLLRAYLQSLYQAELTP